MTMAEGAILERLSGPFGRLTPEEFLRHYGGDTEASDARHFRYVQFSDVPRRLAQGWMMEGELYAPHNHYSVLMAWPCSCPVPK